MNDQEPSNPSRRQLFGGFRPKKAVTIGQGGESYQPTEPMTPSPGLNLDDLPPVYQATLAESQVRDLCRDLSAEASNIRLSCKGVSAADPTQLLDQAAESFLTNQIIRLQIRYTWQNKSWIDTLDKTAEGIRLVRIAHVNQG